MFRKEDLRFPMRLRICCVKGSRPSCRSWRKQESPRLTFLRSLDRIGGLLDGRVHESDRPIDEH